MTRRTLWLTLRAIVGVGLLLATGWALATAGGAVPHQHWALGALLAVAALAGLVLLGATALAWRRDRRSPSEPPEPTRPRTRARRVLGAAGAGAGLVLLAVLAAAVVWIRPFPATDAALSALRADDAVDVVESGGWYGFVPRGEKPTTGLVYSPGARVDVRATAAVLRPLAEAGHLVVALKEPLGIALTSPEQSASAMAAFDGVEHWAVGGHSLGGVAASSFAAAHQDEVDGLLLHASYPLGDMSASDVLVASVSGSQDGLTTPDDIDASRAKLPAATVFTEVEGAVHAFFADYGPQPGDGTPTVPRTQAQAEIVAASEALLAAVAAG